jgi:hypothetical protein
MKVVINGCFGGFGLSLFAEKRFAELKGKEYYAYKQTKYAFRDGRNEYTKITDLNDGGLFVNGMTKDLGEKTNELPNGCWFDRYGNERTDPALLRVIEELGERANGVCAKLEVVEIPDNVEYEIAEYDGNEWIAEKHRTWGK